MSVAQTSGDSWLFNARGFEGWHEVGVGGAKVRKLASKSLIPLSLLFEFGSEFDAEQDWDSLHINQIHVVWDDNCFNILPRESA